LEQFDLFGLAAWAEIAGTIGVVVSLIYVGFEIRHNSNVSQRATDDRIYDAQRPIYTQIMSDPEVAQVIRGGRDNPKSMSENDSFRYQYFLRMNLDLWEGLYGRVDQRLISKSDAAEWDSFFQVWARDYLVDYHWAELKQEYRDDLVIHINAVLDATPR
jgi:hypothetical protein